MNRVVGNSITLFAYLLAFGLNLSAGMRCPCCTRSHTVPYTGYDTGVNADLPPDGIMTCHALEAHGCCGDVEPGAALINVLSNYPSKGNITSHVPCRCSVHASPAVNKYYLVESRTHDSRGFSSFSEMALSNEFNLFPLETRGVASSSGPSPPHRLLHRCLILIV
jgi:hypothetical protein